MSTDLPTGVSPARVAFYNDPKIRSIVYQVALCALIGFLVYGATINAIDQSATRAHRVRLRLLGQHRRLRHQPDADRYSARRLRPMAAPSGSACSTRCWSPGSASSSRPFSASSSASRGCRRTGWCRKSPPAMSRPSATCRCCCNCCSGTTPCSRRCRRCATASPFPAASSSTIAACSCRSRCIGRGFGGVVVALVVGMIAAIAFYIWARKRQERTGQQAPVFLVALALVIGLPFVVLALAGFPLSVRLSAGRPLQHQRRRRSAAGIRRAAVRPVDLYRGLHRRSGARRHHVGVARPDRGGLFARPQAAARPCG